MTHYPLEGLTQRHSQFFASVIAVLAAIAACSGKPPADRQPASTDDSEVERGPPFPVSMTIYDVESRGALGGDDTELVLKIMIIEPASSHQRRTAGEAYASVMQIYAPDLISISAGTGRQVAVLPLHLRDPDEPDRWRPTYELPTRSLLGVDGNHEFSLIEVPIRVHASAGDLQGFSWSIHRDPLLQHCSELSMWSHYPLILFYASDPHASVHP